MFRHLAPVATPLAIATLIKALRAPANAPAQFQAALADYLGVPHCFLASSGRTALALLLQSLQANQDRPDRRAVILPAYTCPALAKVVLDVGLLPRLVDISPVTFAYDPAQLAANLGDGTLAVIVVHPFGIPQTVAPVQAQAAAVGALVIEDAAQAMGARLAGRPVGTIGDYGLFSLGPGKPLSTGGGGIVCVRDAGNAQRLARERRGLSAANNTLALARLTALTAAFYPVGWWAATRVGAQRMGEQPASWGYQSTGLTPAQAAVGCAQLSQLDEYNRRRRGRAEQLIEHLQTLDFVHLPSPPLDEAAQPIYLRLPVIVASETQREGLLRRLGAAGIGAGRLYGRTLAEFFPTLKGVPQPGAHQIARRLLTLPTHHYVTDSDIDRISQIFHQQS